MIDYGSQSPEMQNRRVTAIDDASMEFRSRSSSIAAHGLLFLKSTTSNENGPILRAPN